MRISRLKPVILGLVMLASVMLFFPSNLYGRDAAVAQQTSTPPVWLSSSHWLLHTHVVQKVCPLPLSRTDCASPVYMDGDLRLRAFTMLVSDPASNIRVDATGTPIRIDVVTATSLYDV